MYKLRMFVRERVQKLQATGIKPTLKRVMLLERTLAKHSKHIELDMLVSRVEQADAASMNMDEARPSGDEAVVQMPSDPQTQMQQQQQLLHQTKLTQLEQQLKQLEQQQQQQQGHVLQQLQHQQEQHQQEMSRLQHEVQQLAQQLQHLQQ